MALKIYNSDPEIPTELKEHYTRRADGKYEPVVEGVNSISGVLAKNSELLAQHTTDKAEITRLTGEVSRLNTSLTSQNVLPAGHVAVPKADAALIDAYKPLGTPDEVKTKLTEHGTLKEAVEAREYEDAWGKASEASKYNAAALVKLAKANGLSKPEVREVTEQGKKVQRAFLTVKENNKDVEKPLTDFIENSEDFKPFLPSLKATQTSGTPYPPQPAGGGTSSANEYDEIRNEVKNGQQTVQPKDTPSVLAILSGQRPTTATT